jgi:hypothetical protein
MSEETTVLLETKLYVSFNEGNTCTNICLYIPLRNTPKIRNIIPNTMKIGCEPTEAAIEEAAKEEGEESE